MDINHTPFRGRISVNPSQDGLQFCHVHFLVTNTGIIVTGVSSVATVIHPVSVGGEVVVAVTTGVGAVLVGGL